jgi:threonine aldolase
VQAPQTNIVFVDLAPDKPADIVARLAAQGVLTTGLYRLRLVTHLDVSRDDIERAIPILRQALQ